MNNKLRVRLMYSNEINYNKKSLLFPLLTCSLLETLLWLHCKGKKGQSQFFKHHTFKVLIIRSEVCQAREHLHVIKANSALLLYPGSLTAQRSLSSLLLWRRW